MSTVYEYKITLENVSLGQRRVEKVSSNNLHAAIIGIIRKDLTTLKVGHELIFEDIYDLVGSLPVSEQAIDAITRGLERRQGTRLGGSFGDAIATAWARADKQNKRILAPAMRAFMARV